MLAAPPIQQPLQPFAFAPPSSRSSHPPVPSTSRVPAQTVSLRKPHRHSEEVDAALRLLRRLADQVDERAPRSGGALTDEEEGDEAGIIANLRSHGWIHQTTTSGVRIFHSYSQDGSDNPAPRDTIVSPDRARSVRTTGGRSAMSSALFGTGASTLRSAGQRGPASTGLRADETLPFFRGEGWIEGQWRPEDVAATITSLGARSAWDPRMDASRSYIVEHLSPSDSLAHLSIRGTLVSDRDAALVTSTTLDDRPNKSSVLYVASTSVEDPLLPRTGTRTQITLNGFALRPLARAPDFEPPPSPAPLEAALGTSPPIRPSHRRTRSTMSALQAGGMSPGRAPLPPLPPMPTEHREAAPQRPTLVASATHVGNLTTLLPPPLLRTASSQTSLSGSASMADSPASYPPFSFAPTTNATVPPKRGSLTKPQTPGPGLAVSMLVRAAPGYNLPQTVVNQLSVHLPLAIAAVGRFLALNGFAPHLVRSHGRVKLREECYDPTAGKYRITFTVQACNDGKGDGEEDVPVRIRFHSASFGRGRFDLEIQHVEPQGWTLEYDQPPRSAQDRRLTLHREDEEVGGSGSGQWSSRLSMTTKPNEEGAGRQGRKGSATSLLSPLGSEEPARDQACPSGGCTLVIRPSATNPYLPVTISIARPTNDTGTLPLSKMRGISTALAQASQVALNESSLCDSVEELLLCGQEGGEERAEMLLKGARMVLQELEEAKLREATASATAAAAAAAAQRWRRRAGPISPGGGDYFSRQVSQGGEPGSLSFNSPSSGLRQELPALSPLSQTSRPFWQ
ncbi:hypothetical protein JCM11251_002087 [Rhodosporidiobolus azoricus]